MAKRRSSLENPVAKYFTIKPTFMIKLNFIILSDSAEISPTQNKLNVLGAFDSMFSADFPTVLPALAITVNMEIDEGPHTEHYVIKNEENAVIEDGPRSEFNVEVEKRRHQFIHTINNLRLQAEGKYTVEIYVDGDLQGSTYFLAKRIQQ